MKKTNMKTGIIAAILVIVTVTSIAAFTTATASAAAYTATQDAPRRRTLI